MTGRVELEWCIAKRVDDTHTVIWLNEMYYRKSQQQLVIYSRHRVSRELYTQHSVSFSSGNTERSENALRDVGPLGGRVELRETFHDVLRSPG